MAKVLRWTNFQHGKVSLVTINLKAERVKKTLIHKAKVKKQYSRLLRKIGKEKAHESGMDMDDEESPRFEESDIDMTKSTGRGVILRDEDIPMYSPSIVKKRKEPEATSDEDVVMENDRRSSRLKDIKDRKKIKLDPEDVERKRQKREEERRIWRRKTNKGQPNLNGRIKVLLGKIKDRNTL